MSGGGGALHASSPPHSPTTKPQGGRPRRLAADSVARILATTPGAVYAAKARVMRRLVEKIRAVEADWSLTDFSPEG